MASKVKDTDKGYKALFKKIKGPPRTLRVGILSEAAGASHGAMTVGDIATLHEFGIGQPERSFIRAWADEESGKIEIALRKVAESVIRGKYDLATGLERVGALFAASIQARIAGGIAPANAPSTIAKKGSSTPLIDQGILRSSISHEVGK